MSRQLSKVQPTTKRVRGAKWTELDNAVYEWHQMLERKNIAVSGLIIQLKAAEFWDKLPVYQGQEAPKFSTGWLDKWKSRFGVKKVTLHGEDESVKINDTIEEMMKTLQNKLMGVEEKDVYNMDETALYW